MTAQILTSKLFIPQPSLKLVERPNLIARLNEGLACKLTLISAPAGFGKTTLVAEWIPNSSVPFCWITLDEGDNDMGRFLAYIIACLHSISIDVDEQLLTLIQSPERRPFEAILIPLLNQIAAARQNFALVLDDYHLITSQEVHEAVAFLLDHAPPSMHLVITTRADPPLQLSRLRARGQMTEMRASDLRFSVQEAEYLLNHVQDLQLSIDSLETIMNKTDGWIAALQMISIALKGSADPASYIKELSGNQSYIADYLMDEVINQQPDEIRSFLKQTSILDRLSGALCDAVLGQGNSSQILKYLKTANLFLESLDEENKWFRYHRLFTSLLQQRLRDSQPEIMGTLYYNACTWFEESGHSTEAIDYALRGNYLERAADLIEQNAEMMIARGETNIFIQWVEKLPQEILHAKPLTTILYAWALLVIRSQKQIARTLLEEVKHDSEHLAGRLNTVKAILAIFEGKTLDAIELCHQAMAQLPTEDIFFRVMAAWNLSGALAVSGDTEGGLKVLEEVARLSMASQQYLVAIIALSRLAKAKEITGDIQEARTLYKQALDVAAMNQNRPLPAASVALVGLGKIHWEWNHTEVAKEYLSQGMELGKRWRPTSAIDGYLITANILQSQGDIDGANQIIREAQAIAAQDKATELDDRYVASHQALLWIRQKNLQAVQAWASERGLKKSLDTGKLALSGNRGADIILHYELIVFARASIAESRCQEAMAILDLVLPSMQNFGYLSKIIEIHILYALCMYAQKKIDSALSWLKKTVTLAAPGGYIRTFLEEGEPIAALLQELKAHGELSGFALEVWNAFTPSKTGPTIHTDLLEMLSDREVEILQMLVSDLSAPQIAERLHISVTTMRTHTRNIYSKLGVHSRFEAITKAKELNYL